MSVWLRKDFGTHPYTVAFDRFEMYLISTGRHQDMLMVSEHGPESVAQAIVFIWFANDKSAALFPEFQRCEKPTNPRPTFLIGESGVYKQHFPEGVLS